MRLIDADALIQRIFDEVQIDVVDMIKREPTVTFVPTEPVVRCRECKHSIVCNVKEYLGQTGFCSWGQKADE